ncbi:ATP-binding cassette domain-containing protein [Tumebacillus flagellatus]|uniref:ABC transporter domain-containing protein n=1 Tax=Tumebacillus flagellatus TaxID=1157490 RepID=A0A074M933_9BACL|nr:ATP-binding cassette domain-containing protein [Tumebacillus flagellatus]KEO82467.1 hypothetical protein EL26_15425 [Tumebacillus flagellatus]
MSREQALGGKEAFRLQGVSVAFAVTGGTGEHREAENETTTNTLKHAGRNGGSANPDGIRFVLRDLDLEVRRGDWVAVVGRNGSGKSTLGRVLAGLLPVSRGTLERSAGLVQLVFQTPDAQIVGETVWEDVCFGLENLAVPPDEMPARAEEALLTVGLLEKKHANVSTLSGGQKQLLAVAGCLAMKADVLVFDEATSMLDPESRARLLDVAARLHQAGQTVIWITQWMDEVARAQRVVALEVGRVVFEGAPEVFFYGREGSEGQTPCDSLGFAPPYVVQVARALERRGVALRKRPLLPEEVGDFV